MTERVKDGGRAFPNDGAWANGIPEGGMSLRDWFAQKAPIQEIEELRFRHLSRAAQEKLAGRKHPIEVRHDNKSIEALVAYQIDCANFYAEVTAALRFIMADAMLRAREKGNDHE